MLRLPPSLNNQFIKLGSVSPSMQRLTIGTTALVLQTSIDAKNPYVDDETRKHSATRTAAKMIITTASGFTVREIAQRVGETLAFDKNIKVPQSMLDYYKKKVLEPNFVLTEIGDNKLIDKLIKKDLLPKKLVEGTAKLTKELQEQAVNIVAKANYAKSVGAVTAIAAALMSIFTVDMLFVDPLANKFIDLLQGKKDGTKSE